MRKGLRSLILIVALFGICLPISAQDGPGTVKTLVFGRSYEGAVPLAEEGAGYVSYALRVDEDVFAVRLDLKNAPADLDIYARYGAPIDDYKNVDVSSTDRVFNESLFLSRLSPQPLQTGVYYIDVVYRSDHAPLQEYRRMKEIPFEIEAVSVSMESTVRLKPGEPFSGELNPEMGMARSFRLRLPAGVEECRIDLFDTDANLDILVGYEKPVLSRKNADYIGDSLIGNESLVFRGARGLSTLPAGTYYITVYDPVQSRYSETFGIQVSLGEDVPQRLLRVPRFPLTDDELQQTIHATVEVAGELGRGSGCIVSSDGYILTSWHVVKGASGGPADELFVSATLDPQSPPEELFKARVLEYDRQADIALLEIVSGIHGQPLPDDYTFPHMPIGESVDLRVGQPVSLLGYPGAGSAGSRVSVSLSRGIISGFVKREGVSMIKTDTLILPGSSGGAAINPYYELIGIISYTIGETGNSLGFLYPVSEIPETWLERIRSRGSF